MFTMRTQHVASIELAGTSQCVIHYMGSKPIKVKVLYERFLFDSLLALRRWFSNRMPFHCIILSWNLRKDFSDPIPFSATQAKCLIKHTKCTQICVNAGTATEVNDSLCKMRWRHRRHVGTEEGDVKTTTTNKANRNNHEKEKKRRTNRYSPLHLGRRRANAKLSKFWFEWIQ